MIDITSSNMPVSNRVKSFLKEKGIKQSAIARNSGFTLQEFNDMLNGRRIMRFDLQDINCIIAVWHRCNFLLRLRGDDIGRRFKSHA